MNLLFTCAGRRNYLIEFFKTIKGLRTTACDASYFAPALYAADEFFIVPEVYDVGYIPYLLRESKARDIDAIISLNDLELPVLASSKHKFETEGIKVIVSDNSVIDTCFDKYRTVSFCENLPVSKVPTFLKPEDALEYLKSNSSCKFIIKPRWGSASIGIEYPQNETELVQQYSICKKKLMNSVLNKISSTDYDMCILLQKKLTGQEYGMDVINNLDAKFEAVLIRKKIAMRSGETDKAETIHDKRLSQIGMEIGQKLKHIGILDCDLFIENNCIYLLEMNPRFGGGYPFMHFAGANYPLALVEWLKGNNTPPGCFNYEANFISSKVDTLVRIR